MTGNEQELAAELGWGAFALKIAGALAWMVASAVAANVVAAPTTSGLVRAAAGLALLAPAAAWLHLSRRRMKRVDEFNSNLIGVAMNSGANWAVVFGPIVVGVMTIMALASGGHTNILRFGYLLVCIQPAAGMLFGESMAQVARRRYAGQGGR